MMPADPSDKTPVNHEPKKNGRAGEVSGSPASLTDATGRPQTESVSLEFELNHSPAKVWRALTDPALLTEWLLPVIGLKVEPGSAFMFRAPPQPGWDGTVNCRVVAIEPLKKLSWSWTVGEKGSGFHLDTTVTFALAPTVGEGGKAGTRLSIVQTGFGPDQKQNLAGARYGWKMMGGKLVELLGRIP